MNYGTHIRLHNSAVIVLENIKIQFPDVISAIDGYRI